jgi:hypothetical protein
LSILVVFSALVVLVALASQVALHGTPAEVTHKHCSSHPSPGVIQILHSQSHVFLYSNISSLIFASPACIHSFVLGFWIAIVTSHPFELSVRYIFILSQLTVYEGSKIEGSANEYPIKLQKIAARIIDNFLMGK